MHNDIGNKTMRGSRGKRSVNGHKISQSTMTLLVQFRSNATVMSALDVEEKSNETEEKQRSEMIDENSNKIQQQNVQIGDFKAENPKQSEVDEIMVYLEKSQDGVHNNDSNVGQSVRDSMS